MSDELKIRKAFQSVAFDIESMRRSFNDWVLYIVDQNRDLKLRVAELEKRLGKATAAELEVY